MKVHMLLLGEDFTLYFVSFFNMLIIKILLLGIYGTIPLHIPVFQLKSYSTLLNQSLSLFNSPFEKHDSVALLIII